MQNGRAVKPFGLVTAAASRLMVPPDYRSVRSMPAQGEPVHARGVVVVPAAPVAGDPATAVIVAYTVPPGWLFLLTDLLTQYMGATVPADYEGLTTELFYSLRVDGRYFVKDFGVISTTLGSLEGGPYPISGGVQFAAGKLVELLVNVPVGSSIATGGTNRVFGHLVGWTRPGGRTAVGAAAAEG